MATNGELITSLPTDDTAYTKEQLEMAKILFKENEGTLNILANELKESLIICTLFIIFTLPYIDEYIKKIIPISQGSYPILMGFKCIFIIILFYIVKNFHLSRKP